MIGCLRLLARTSWLRLAGVPALLGVLCWALAESVATLYGGEAERAVYRATIEALPVSAIFNGRPYDLDALGGVVTTEMGLFVLAIFPVIAISTAIALTRGLEDTGRLELITATRVSRAAPLLAGAVLSLASCAAAGVSCTLGFVAAGLPTQGSLLLGGAIGAIMAAFAVVGLVAAQLAQTGRGAHLLALGLLAANYLLRGWQDATRGDLTWLGPQQWFAEVRGFSDSPPAWPWLAFAGWIVLVGALAVLLGARRDLGAGLFQLPPGPAAGRRWLASPLALHWVLTRASGLGWMLMTAAWGVALGLMSSEVEEMLTASPMLQEVFGVGMDAMVALTASTLMVFAAAAGVQVAGTLGAEEVAGRAGRVLASPIRRTNWGLAAMGMSLGWALAVLGAGAVAAGLGFSWALDDGSWFGEAVRATLAMAPGVGLVAGLAMALTLVRPRLGAVSWALVVWALVVAWLAETLDLPDWARRISPFAWLGEVPLEAWDRPAAVIMSVLAVAICAAGVGVLGRRDLVAG